MAASRERIEGERRSTKKDIHVDMKDKGHQGNCWIDYDKIIIELSEEEGER